MTIMRLLRDARGATAVEYGFLVALIACAIAGFLGQIGRKLTGILTYLMGYLPG